jgi:hypothetical protein
VQAFPLPWSAFLILIGAGLRKSGMAIAPPIYDPVPTIKGQGGLGLDRENEFSAC